MQIKVKTSTFGGKSCGIDSAAVVSATCGGKDRCQLYTSPSSIGDSGCTPGTATLVVEYSCNGIYKRSFSCHWHISMDINEIKLFKKSNFEGYRRYGDTFHHVFLLKFTFSTCSVPVPCQLGEFTCDSGECIAENKRCDGIKDCADNTDELCSFMGGSCYIGINYFML